MKLINASKPHRESGVYLQTRETAAQPISPRRFPPRISIDCRKAVPVSSSYSGRRLIAHFYWVKRNSPWPKARDLVRIVRLVRTLFSRHGTQSRETSDQEGVRRPGFPATLRWTWPRVRLSVKKAA
jgi:hypothetical protein